MIPYSTTPKFLTMVTVRWKASGPRLEDVLLFAQKAKLWQRSEEKSVNVSAKNNLISICSLFVDAQMHQDSNVRSLMRFAKLYNLELHLMTKVEHEKHVKPSLQSLGSASIQPRKSHLKVNVPLLK